MTEQSRNTAEVTLELYSQKFQKKVAWLMEKSQETEPDGKIIRINASTKYLSRGFENTLDNLADGILPDSQQQKVFAVLVKDTFVGIVRFHSINMAASPQVYTSRLLATKFCKKGYGTRALVLLLEKGFTMGFKQIGTIVSKANKGGQTSTRRLLGKYPNKVLEVEQDLRPKDLFQFSKT